MSRLRLVRAKAIILEKATFICHARFSHGKNDVLGIEIIKIHPMNMFISSRADSAFRLSALTFPQLFKPSLCKYVMTE